MKEIKCIYCGKGIDDGIDLSESDIIPDSLTNSKIKNKNVCKLEHNNKFSDKFESKIINELSYIRNHFNIKGKNNNYPSYKTEYEINGINYEFKVKSDLDVLGRKNIVSKEKGSILGPIEKIEKIKESKGFGDIDILDLNNLEINKKIKLDLNIFFCEEMYRLVSKIAYEWFCKVREINDRKDEFENIIKYIVDGTIVNNKNIVEIITDNGIYNDIDFHCEHGSHCLVSYVSENGDLCVVAYLFGILMYKITLCQNYTSDTKNTNFFYQEFKMSGSNKFISGNMEDPFEAYIKNISEGINIGGGINLVIEDSEKFQDSVMMNIIQAHLQNLDSKVLNLNDAVNIVIKNLGKLYNYVNIDEKYLKRFVNEYNLEHDIKINKKNEESRLWIPLFIVFSVGINNSYDISLNDINKIIKSELSVLSNNIEIDSKGIEKIKNKILSTEKYKEHIKNGAKIINLNL